MAIEVINDNLYKRSIAKLGFEISIPGPAVRQATVCAMKLAPFTFNQPLKFGED